MLFLNTQHTKSSADIYINKTYNPMKMCLVYTDEEHCPGCAGVYTDEEDDLWSGCDVSEKHWWHYRCAGYKRKPSLRRHFVCPFRSEFLEIICKFKFISVTCRKVKQRPLN